MRRGRSADRVAVTTVLELGPLVPDATRRASFAFPVPNEPAVIGFQMNVQAVQWYTYNSLGLDYSNGVRLTFGM
jgi:hypothetical protein